MKPSTKRLISYLVAATLIPVAAFAESGDAKNQGYLVDSRGDIVMSGTGLCWHTSDWTPARAVEGCDPVARPVAAATPAPMAAAPAPMPAAPEAKAQPAKPLPQKMSLSSEELFAFDKSDIRPQGKVKLDDFLQQLDGATYDTVTVTGHTDRLGSSAYNQKLSERRAGSVKDYLVAHNVPANRISAQGMGKTQPITKAGECTGRKSAKLISCLQPDRRVEVEVVGTKAAAPM